MPWSHRNIHSAGQEGYQQICVSLAGKRKKKNDMCKLQPAIDVMPRCLLHIKTLCLTVCRTTTASAILRLIWCNIKIHTPHQTYRVIETALCLPHTARAVRIKSNLATIHILQSKYPQYIPNNVPDGLHLTVLWHTTHNLFICVASYYYHINCRTSCNSQTQLTCNWTWQSFLEYSKLANKQANFRTNMGHDITGKLGRRIKSLLPPCHLHYCTHFNLLFVNLCSGRNKSAFLVRPGPNRVQLFIGGQHDSIGTAMTFITVCFAHRACIIMLVCVAKGCTERKTAAHFIGRTCSAPFSRQKDHKVHPKLSAQPLVVCHASTYAPHSLTITNRTKTTYSPATLHCAQLASISAHLVLKPTGNASSKERFHTNVRLGGASCKMMLLLTGHDTIFASKSAQNKC